MAIVGAIVAAPRTKALHPAGKVTTTSKPRIRSERQRVSRQLVTKASHTPADVVPSSGSVKISRRFR